VHFAAGVAPGCGEAQSHECVKFIKNTQYIAFSSRITRVAAVEVRGSDSYMFCLMCMLVRTAVAYYGIYCEPP
jgi:hypothetical protein